MLLQFFRRIGVLRTGLTLATMVVMCAAPFADGQVHMHDWRLFPGVVAPAVMMMLAFTWPLDMTMAGVFMSDASAAEKGRLQMIIRFDAALLALMVLAWLPFILKVLDFSPFAS